MKDLNMQNCYMVVPRVGLCYETIEKYWSLLDQANTLKYRWADVEDVDTEWVMEYIKEMKGMYFILDCTSAFIVAEFTLDNFTGKAAQIHFSMNPNNDSKLNTFLADKVSDMVLTNWVDINNLETGYLDTLFGLTPMENRAACIFVLKAGFTRLGTLPSGSFYLGNIVDSMISIRTAEEIVSCHD